MIGLEDRTRSIALVIVGVLAGAALLADLTDASGGLPWQLALVGLVAVLLLSGRDRSGPPAPPGPDPAPGPGPSPGAPAGTEQPTYAPAYSPTSAPPAYGPPTYEQPAYAPPRSPRRRGPVLFWFTLALVTLAEGVLGVVDLAGAPVAAAAYPALALGLVGAMLVVGSFFGRAGGLIALGLLTVPVLAVATVADEVDPQPVRETPLVAASVDERYDLGAGELVLDLTRVEDLESLDGRDLVLDVGVGSVEVVVPEGLSVDAEVVVGGVGHLWLFDEEREGFDLRAEETYDAGADAPQITLRADLGIGEIRVRTEEEQ